MPTISRTASSTCWPKKEQVNGRIWRTDPKYGGISNTCADDGTHVEHLVHYVTGLKIKRLLATTDTFGKKLDLNDNIILEYENGVHGAYWFLQVACGCPNEIDLRIMGTRAALSGTRPVRTKWFTSKGRGAPHALPRRRRYRRTRR